MIERKYKEFHKFPMKGKTRNLSKGSFVLKEYIKRKMWCKAKEEIENLNFL